MSYCEVHTMVLKELDSLKKEQKDLLTIDRNKTQQMADLQMDIATLKTDMQYTKQAIDDLKKDTKQSIDELKTDTKQSIDDLKSDVTNIQTGVTEINSTLTTLAGMKSSLDSVKERVEKNKWQPKDICVLIGALLAFASAIIVALIK